MISSLKSGLAVYSAACRKVYLAATVGAAKYSTVFMLVVGVSILSAGLADISQADLSGRVGVGVSFGGGSGGSFGDPGVGVSLGDGRIHNVTDRLFELIEGNLGALIMVAAGLGAIIAAAFGAYRMAISLLVVAVGAFILRSLVDIFFNFD